MEFVINANQILVEALEQAVAELESEAGRLKSDWENLAACNCGIYPPQSPTHIS